MTDYNAQMPVACPVHAIRTDSKTARKAAQMVKHEPGARLVGCFSYMRQIVGGDSANRSGVGVSPVEQDDPIRASIFFLKGEAHRQRRAASVRFFTPKAITTRRRPVFLGRLFRVPGVRLVRAPDIHWVLPMLQSCELRNTVVECARA